MRARGLTKTNHSTAQLATTGLTDNSIDALWEYRYRVRTWTISGSFVFDLPVDPNKTVTFTGTWQSGYEPGGGYLGGELDSTIQTGAQWGGASEINSTITFGGDCIPSVPHGGGPLTISDLSILRPELTVVPPSTRAQATVTLALSFYIDLLATPPDDKFTFTISTVAVGTPFSATIDGRSVTVYVSDIGQGWPFGATVMTPTLSFTPLAYWPYSDGTTPIWNAATGAQLAPTWQTPM